MKREVDCRTVRAALSKKEEECGKIEAKLRRNEEAACGFKELYEVRNFDVSFTSSNFNLHL